MQTVLIKAYRHKPLIVKAIQWYKNGDHPLDYDYEVTSQHDGRRITREYQKENDWQGQIVRRYCRHDVSWEKECGRCGQKMMKHGWIGPLETGYSVCPGDYIIAGTDGRHYPCSPYIFKQLYDPVMVEEEEGVYSAGDTELSLRERFFSFPKDQRDRILEEQSEALERYYSRSSEWDALDEGES